MIIARFIERRSQQQWPEDIWVKFVGATHDSPLSPTAARVANKGLDQDGVWIALWSLKQRDIGDTIRLSSVLYEVKADGGQTRREFKYLCKRVAHPA